MDTGHWSGGLAEWIEGDTAYLSIAFTWRLPDAYQRAVFYRSQGFKIRAGGPGIFTQMKYLAEVAELPATRSEGALPDAVARHNPMATFASRGCPLDCSFCIVPKMQGRTFTLLPDFPVRPLLCDNNLSALPPDYQQHIVDRYKAAKVPLLDANSGFEPSTFTEDVFERWRHINHGPWRFGSDEAADRVNVARVIKMLRGKGVSARRIRPYVVIGNEPVAECLDRLNEVIGWGAEPHVQWLMKLNALERKPHVKFDWSAQLLRDMARWANRRGWRYTDFAGYRRKADSRRDRRPDNPDLFAA